MVTSALQKKLFRTILRSRGQSIAVIMVVTCGIASYICMNTAYLNLKLTRDSYYAEHRLADFEIMLERAPSTTIFKVEELAGVRQARGRIVEDVSVDIAGISAARIGRMISMPSPRRSAMNDVQVMSGRYFEPGAQDEVILSKKFAESNALAIGDRLSATIKQKKHSLRIVGIGLSPEYVYMIRNAQEMLPSPEKFGIMWVPVDFAESALDMKEACNNIVGLVDDATQLDEILDRANKLLEPYGVFAKVKGEDQISSRYIADEIRGLGVSATILPSIFLGVAAMILLVVLNRLVRTERSQIGLMKAYGYSNITVAFHYIQYGLILGAAGCVLGFGLGQWLANGMVKLYIQFYQFPLLESRIHVEVLVRSMGIAMSAAGIGALMAAVRAARIQPAEAMRPEPPRSAHRIWLE
jgi:putative ABC transport system permease protein